MTDKELVSAVRCCTSTPKIERCKAECVFFCGGNLSHCISRMGKAVSNRFEALLAENEWLKAQLPKWVSVEERLPESNDKCVLTVVNGVYGGIHFYDAIEIAEFVLDEGWILESYPDWENPNVTYWRELPEPPSTEGGGVNER